MYRRFILLFCAFYLCMVLIGCAADDGTETTDHNEKSAEQSEAIFSNGAAVEALCADWFFIPANAVDVETKEYLSKLEASFYGCNFNTINAYAEDIVKTMRDRGFKLYTVKISEAGLIAGLELIEKIEPAINDEYFSGAAYTLIGQKENKYFSVTVKYYGSAGGTEGNGYCTVTIKEENETYKHYDKEAEQQ